VSPSRGRCRSAAEHCAQLRERRTSFCSVPERLRICPWMMFLRSSSPADVYPQRSKRGTRPEPFYGGGGVMLSVPGRRDVGSPRSAQRGFFVTVGRIQKATSEAPLRRPRQGITLGFGTKRVGRLNPTFSRSSRPVGHAPPQPELPCSSIRRERDRVSTFETLPQSPPPNPRSAQL